MITHKDFKAKCNNRLLALLPEDEFALIAPNLELIELEYEALITKRNEPIRHVHFPCNCIGSIITELESGHAVEIGAVGNEGMTNVLAFLGGEIAIDTMLCQIPGLSARIDIHAFLNATEANTTLRKVCALYAQVYLSTACQSVACNRFHRIEQRLARWLLMSHDRVGRDTFPITQEFMAIMLGTERPSVSQAAKVLMDAGLVDYARGRMHIVNRQGLEARACECYQVTRNQFKTIMGIDIG